METNPEVKIEGLEEALQQLDALSRAIDDLGESARWSFLALADTGAPEEVDGPTRGPDSLSSSLSGGQPAIDAPELEAATGSLSTVVTKLDGSVGALNDAVDTLAQTVPGLSMQRVQLMGPDPEQLQLQLGALQLTENSGSGFAEIAAQTATGLGVATTGAGHPYIGVPIIVGGLGASWAIEANKQDSLYPYDEEALQAMETIRSWGDISQVEDGLIFSREGAANARAGLFWEKFDFFAQRLKELDKIADGELSPLVDEPREFYRREQARSLRSLYSKNFLELIDRYKTAVGGDPTEINAGPVFNQLMRTPVGIDPAALELANKYAAAPHEEIAPNLVSSAAVQFAQFKPIDIQIQIASDVPVKTSTNNPNPNIRIGIIDMYSGPRMRW
jgi:hypothetical protein